MPDRRQFLAAGTAGLIAASGFPGLAFAAAQTSKRFVFIIQRGAADGLNILAPISDPAYAGLRGRWDSSLEGGKPVGSFFLLHPQLGRTGAFYDAGQASFYHAVASSYRDRSHFDGQNILETGGLQAYAEPVGWLNRLVGLLPGSEGLAVTQALPAAMRGPAHVTTLAPSGMGNSREDMLMRVDNLYAEDPQFHPVWQTAMASQALLGDAAELRRKDAETIATFAARMLSPASGARIAMVETAGWDTHISQAGLLAGKLGELDLLVATLADELGPVWAETMVLVATEFGRTAAINGTNGTDHGTGAMAILLGGAVRGGKVLSDWPGLRQSNLYEGRDLMPTTAFEALASGAAASHFGLDPELAALTLFPAHDRLKPLII